MAARLRTARSRTRTRTSPSYSYFDLTAAVKIADKVHGAGGLQQPPRQGAAAGRSHQHRGAADRQRQHLPGRLRLAGPIPVRRSDRTVLVPEIIATQRAAGQNLPPFFCVPAARLGGAVFRADRRDSVPSASCLQAAAAAAARHGAAAGIRDAGTGRSCSGSGGRAGSRENPPGRDRPRAGCPRRSDASPNCRAQRTRRP